ncbi:MAG: peptidyl-prolyl cis-trans isomerase [Odoribacteraceae bacterium]|jgi:hypothetical protein|nr:peptidyl-prolyl cis-trans isomerase [Odoribacteraceae bacterium]
MKFLPVVILLFVPLCACKKEFAGDSASVAKVMDRYLYASEVAAFIPAGTPKQDSANMAQGYVRNWITKELLLAKAVDNLTEEERNDIRKQVEDYSASLLIHKYKGKLVAQKMDRVVRDADIDAYYDQNKVNFVLNHPVVRALLIIIPKSTANIAGFRDWFRSDKPEAFSALEEYCLTHAKKFDNFNNRWIELRYLLNFLPVDQGTWEEKHKNDSRAEMEDDENYYFLKINEMVRDREVAPVGYVKQEIELILLNKRKLEFEENLERQINEEGTRKHFVSIHE